LFQRLSLTYDESLSNFALKNDLRHYAMALFTVNLKQIFRHLDATFPKVGQIVT
jgi:hypothetical protein